MKASQRLIVIEATYGDVIPRRDFEDLKKRFVVCTTLDCLSLLSLFRQLDTGVESVGALPLYSCRAAHKPSRDDSRCAQRQLLPFAVNCSVFCPCEKDEYNGLSGATVKEVKN